MSSKIDEAVKDARQRMLKGSESYAKVVERVTNKHGVSQAELEAELLQAPPPGRRTVRAPRRRE